MKTAEEMVKDLDLCTVSIHKIGIIMREFAAQEVAREVESYKAKLTSEIELLNKTRHSWLLERVLSLINEINTTK